MISAYPIKFPEIDINIFFPKLFSKKSIPDKKNNKEKIKAIPNKTAFLPFSFKFRGRKKQSMNS